MARKTVVTQIDDLDGTVADEAVIFAVDGASYEIDLSSDNAQALREGLASWIGHARKSGGRGAARPSAAPKRSASRSSSNASELRAWARENGFQVSERGRISEQIRQAYAAAH